MNNLIKDKKIVIICIVFVLVFVIYFIIMQTEKLPKGDREFIDDIKYYEENKVIPVYVTEEEMADKYLNDYKNILINDKMEAYNLLNKEYREKKFGSFEKFSEYVDNLYSDTFYSLYVKEYGVSYEGGKYFYIKANNGNTYIFREKSIMNYEVYLDNYTVEIK